MFCRILRASAMTLVFPAAGVEPVLWSAALTGQNSKHCKYTEKKRRATTVSEKQITRNAEATKPVCGFQKHATREEREAFRSCRYERGSCFPQLLSNLSNLGQRDRSLSVRSSVDAASRGLFARSTYIACYSSSL